MTLLTRHKTDGGPDPDGRWRIVRWVNGRTVIEVHEDFDSARHRLGRIAREKRRQLSRLRQRGGQR
ncbi:MAG: hypothetical protein WDM89_08290 [Rhizomicrobium sp.]